jgi:hypothetical protein
MTSHTVAFALIAALFGFAVIAFAFGDFWYCLAFLATLLGVFYIVEPTDS